MKVTTDKLKKLIRMVEETKSEEIGCNDCFDELNEFAEMKLNGKSPEEAMLLVKDHLNRCSSCSEEYEALLEAMRRAL